MGRFQVITGLMFTLALLNCSSSRPGSDTTISGAGGAGEATVAGGGQQIGGSATAGRNAAGSAGAMGGGPTNGGGGATNAGGGAPNAGGGVAGATGGTVATGGGSGGPTRQGHWMTPSQNGQPCTPSNAVQRFAAQFQVCTGGCAPGCSTWDCVCRDGAWLCREPEFICQNGAGGSGACSTKTELRYDCLCTPDQMRCEPTSLSGGAGGEANP